ncbi:beta-1,4-mannosyltransferase egh-like [Mytilus californianus]|uniref:beta-1,4-mannosyltransferase egh-like n=1 Tax=Mytilus californianus TaxID=6549 RepID=UPI0022479F63|nr:beta-1,4-mannosyltransferase egh-like [Mytilus californianus]XP_052103054.1 beta-1,4-mannosyltransferase egh-like [Mytilus californianus]
MAKLSGESINIKHCLTIFLFLIILTIVCFLTGGFSSTNYSFDPYKAYGKWPTIILYIMRYITLIHLPIVICNFLGIVMFNTHPSKPKLKTSPMSLPSICFRVVTKGKYPHLVNRTVDKNIKTCLEVGLHHYQFEIVTDSPIGLPNNSCIREVVVPSTYSTTNGSLYKARALQFALEDEVNILSDNDWIVHLDEETVLTESSVIGIANFIHDDIYSFGQGVIIYTKEEIVCWITTLADLVRIGTDYGRYRFCFKCLHRPILGTKGSFLVVKASVELNVTFDFGVDGSLTEDCFFALKAWMRGYTCGFIEGEMWEKSPFSPKDFVLQRKRWIQGHLKTLFCKTIPMRYKLGIFFIVLSYFTILLSIPNMVLVPLIPLPIPQTVSYLSGFTGGVMAFLYVFGCIKSFDYRRLGLFKFIFLCILPILLLPVFITMEYCAVVLAFLTSGGFHIVEKELPKQLLI